MKAVTWIPGENAELDQLFDLLREQQYQNQEHRLWKNYGKDSFQYAVALTICFNSDNVPEICSSIASRDCWPKNAYRILNRMWKHSNKVFHSKRISEAMAASVVSQISWLKENTTCDLYFISRQTNNWMDWVAEKFKQQYSIDFNIASNKYLTCPNECDETCWQHVIYSGNKELLAQWKSK